MPYFKKIFKKDPASYALQANHGIHGSAYDLRMRSPSYNGTENNSSNKYLKSEQIAQKRKISVEKSSSDQYTSPFILRPNMPPTPYDKNPPQANYNAPPKNTLELPKDELSKDRRAMSSEKFYNMHHKEEHKHDYQVPEHKKSYEDKAEILSGELSFK